MKYRMILWGICLGLAVSLSACGESEYTPIVVESIPITETEVEAADPGLLTEKEQNDEVHQQNSDKREFQELRFGFADAKEGADFLLGNRDYLKKLTQNDLNFRMQKKDATLEGYTAFAKKQTLDFTEEEKAAVSDCMQKIKDICAERNYKLPAVEEITFVKTTMQEEAGATAYTHGMQIYVGEAFLSLLCSEDSWVKDYGNTIMVHELFHCLTRNDAQFRVDMYEILGFQIEEEEFAFTPEVREKILSNPDVGKYDAYATFRIDGQDRDCVVVFTTTRPFQNPGDSMFELMMTGLVPVEDPSVIYPAESAENFWQVFGRNTEYVIDPEEVLADNFSYAVMYGEEGMDYKSPQMIRAICDYLRR